VVTTTGSAIKNLEIGHTKSSGHSFDRGVVRSSSGVLVVEQVDAPLLFFKPAASSISRDDDEEFSQQLLGSDYWRLQQRLHLLWSLSSPQCPSV
jgi:hypothetical protein